MSAAIDVGSFSNGDDSDDGEDAEWRMRFKQVLLHEFVDMMAVEKVSMNLWNQFILGEYRISSDRFVLPAVKEFVVRYGGEIKRMQIEMIFVRHIVVLSNCGVLDADGVDEIWELLREIPPNGEIEGRFKYARRTLKDERGLRQNYSDADWKDAGSADDESGDSLDEDPFNHRQLLESLQNNVDAAGLPFFESPDALAQMNLIDAAEQPSSPTPAGPSAQTSAAVPVHVVAGSSEFHKKNDK